MTTSICVFGEVLFDHFPDGRRVLGGAPFNVAWHLQAFGENPRFLSRIGSDNEGREVSSAMQEWGMDVRGLQHDDELPTGRVQVSFNEGEPSYEIIHPAAWDAILPSSAPLSCPWLYHGSLALRSGTSRNTWRELRTGKVGKVFIDVNLRAPWFEPELLIETIKDANWVKLNDHELNYLAPGHAAAEQRAFGFIEKHGIEGLVLTAGARGATVLTAAGDVYESQPVNGIVIADTVGAGDALAAVMILGLARAWPLQLALDRAQEFASEIVRRRGATVADPAFYQALVNGWNRNV